MKTRTPICAAACTVIMMGLGSAAIADDKEIFREQTASYCTDASRDASATAARNNAEAYVKRAAASILPPMPVEELGCLDDLMAINIDVLSGAAYAVDAILNDLQAGLRAAVAGAAAAVCSVAEQRWNEATEPLNMSLADLTNGSIAPEYTDRFTILGVSDNSPGGPGVTVNAPNTSMTFSPAPMTETGTPESGAAAPEDGPVTNIFNNILGE